MSTKTLRHQTFDSDGNVIDERVEVVDTTVEDNAAAIEQAVEDALVDLQTALDAVDEQRADLTALRDTINTETATLQTISGTTGTLTAAQLSGAVRALADAGLVHFQASKEIGRLEVEIIEAIEVLARNQRRIIRRLIAEVRPDRRDELLSRPD